MRTRDTRRPWWVFITLLALSLAAALHATAEIYPARTAPTPSPMNSDAKWKRIQEILNSDPPPTGKQCQWGQSEILRRLDAMREDPQTKDLFQDISYGPAQFSNSQGGHQGVVFYYKKDLDPKNYKTPESYYGELIKDGVVAEYTNWTSDWFGWWNYRDFSQWGPMIDWYGPSTICDSRKYYPWPPSQTGQTGGDFPKPDPIDWTKVDPWELLVKDILKTIVSSSYDPNDLLGVPGVGAERFIPEGTVLTYTIDFENLETAGLPAQEVVVTDALNAGLLDLSTFSLGTITVGGQSVTPPAAARQFSTVMDLRPAQPWLVRVEVGLNELTGLLTWRFTTLDPLTSALPDDPTAGFLPPNKVSPQGEGSASFSVHLRPGLPTGTRIANRASIVFDTNPAIETPEWVNTLDADPPTSAVASLPATSAKSSFAVSWAGQDQGSGISSYDVLVSTDGSTPQLWKGHTTDTTGTFAGQPGHQYGFLSLSRDAAGNEEVAPTGIQAITRTPDRLPGDVTGDGKVNIADALLALRFMSKLSTPTDEQLAAADMTGNGKVDIGDVVKILRRALLIDK